MKKIILTSAIIFATLAGAYAQTSGDVTLNVKLNPIQTLLVNADQKIVNLDYLTKEDYATGVSSTQADHLNIYSVGAFTVSVSSLMTGLSGNASNAELIDAAGISIQAAAGSNSIAGATYAPAALGTVAKPIISSSKGGVNKNFNITYKAQGGDAYVEKYFNGENPTVYTTTVTYTIAAN